LKLNASFPIDAAGVAPDFAGDPALLMYLQCGVTIERANALLFERQLSLKTSGASNGQTIAGALSTGTHGSRFAFGSIPEFVRGLHLITGPDRILWLERASDPVLSDGAVATLGAELVRDDTLFNAALVSFGSFGVIFGVLIEAEPYYLIEEWRRRLDIDEALKQTMRTLDFTGIRTPYPAEKPLHFEVVINPHDLAGGAYVTTMYQRPYRSDYVHPFTEPGGLGPGDDVIGVMGKIADVLGGAVVGPAVNLVVNSQYPLYDNETGHKPVVFGTHGEIFHSNRDFQKELSAEIGVALEDTARAYDLMINLSEVRDYPGLLAFRWVKGSQALMAFTKYPVTCAIELPAAFADSTLAYYDAVWNALEAAGIDYTLHWGQLNNFTPDRVSRMYGAARQTWIDARNRLLTPEVRAVFTSSFLRQCGLG
jgi:hypothetical protein